MSTSSVPVASVAIALVVLAAAAVALLTAALRGARDKESASLAAQAEAPPRGPVRTGAGEGRGDVDEEALSAFLVALGEAMIDSSDPVTHVQHSLRRVAEASGISAAGIVVLPTVMIVSLPGAGRVQTSVAIAGTASLRLDQVDEVFRVAREAERGELDPVAGVQRLRIVRAAPAPFDAVARAAGHALFTVGLALVLGGNFADLVVAAVLGVVIGVVHQRMGRLELAYRVFVPVLSAFTAAMVVFLLPRSGVELGIVAPLVASIVPFMPGSALTTAVIELTTGQMISGASRLASGAMQIILLALGIVAAAQLVGIPAGSVRSVAGHPLGDVAPWIGVALFGVGVVIDQCAGRRSLGWILLVLYVSYAGQVIGGLLFGGVLSALVGAFVMTPVAMFVATRETGPPTLVSFLPAFWLLVPGALGLIGVTQLIGDEGLNGLNSLLTTVATMISIAFGVLLGLAAGTAALRLGGVTEQLRAAPAEP